jgi:hypothetical protein
LFPLIRFCLVLFFSCFLTYHSSFSMSLFLHWTYCFLLFYLYSPVWCLGLIPWSVLTCTYAALCIYRRIPPSLAA